MTEPKPGRGATPPREPGPDIPGRPGPDIPEREGPDLAEERVNSEVPAEPGPEIPDRPPEAEVPAPEMLSPDVEETMRQQREVPLPAEGPQPTDELLPESETLEYEPPDEPTSLGGDLPTPSDERSGETLDERLDQEQPEGPGSP